MTSFVTFPVTVYLAGPYRGKPLNDNIPQNVAQAIQWWNTLTDAGFLVFCPHLNMLLDMAQPRSAECWLKWDIHWLRKCDALFRMPGGSDGADTEIGVAYGAGIPVFDSLDGLCSHFENREGL